MKLTIVVVLFCLLARQANSAAPGLRIAITEKGLDYSELNKVVCIMVVLSHDNKLLTY